MSKHKVEERNPHALYCDDPSLTQQHFKEECDINEILKRAQNGVDPVHVNTKMAQYVDVSEVPDFREAHDVVIRARNLFESLDAKVRERFLNDPARMIAFLQVPENREEALKLGLLKAPEAPKPDLHLETLKSIDSSLKSGVPAAGKGKAKPAPDAEE